MHGGGGGLVEISIYFSSKSESTVSEEACYGYEDQKVYKFPW